MLFTHSNTVPLHTIAMISSFTLHLEPYKNEKCETHVSGERHGGMSLPVIHFKYANCV